MSKSHYNRDVKVPQSVIDEIRKLGMSAAIKKAESGGASKQFIEGVRRFYPKGQSIEADPKKRQQEAGKKLARARADEAKKNSSSSSSRSNSRPQPEGPPAPASSAVDRRLGRNRGAKTGPQRGARPAPRQLGTTGHMGENFRNSPPGKAIAAVKGAASSSHSGKRRAAGKTGSSTFKPRTVPIGEAWANDKKKAGDTLRKVKDALTKPSPWLEKK